MNDLATLAQAFARVRRAEAEEWNRIAEESQAERREWLAQGESPFGTRRHCAIVRRRIEGEQGGAAIVGRRHLLTPDAVAEELVRMSERRRKCGTGGVREELEAELRLVRGGRR